MILTHITILHIIQMQIQLILFQIKISMNQLNTIHINNHSKKIRSKRKMNV